MKVKSFTIPIYDYRVTLVEIESKEDKDKFIPVFKRIGPNKEDFEEELSNLDDGLYNGGMTYTNTSIKTFMIILYPMKSKKKRLGVLGHEKRHIEDRLLEHCQVNDIEAAAYLAGFLTEKLMFDK